MEFCDEKDYENISLLDNLEIPNILDNLGSGILEVKNTTKGTSFKVKVELSAKEVDVLKAGGKLNYTKNQAN
ncbi:aconitate hydratase domain protein [Clostridioides difficile P37]|nr:aconitate hydratase domain protein [Clostridioides difficile]ERM36693.1 aconitate hydratase domain protein [Clostridioides difficile P37]